MATPVYATNMTLIDDAADSTGWAGIGGGGSLVSGETDFFVEGSACLSKNTSATWDTVGTPRGGAYYTIGSNITIPANGAVIMWCYWWAPNALDTLAGEGMEMLVGNAATAYYGFKVGGSDSPALGGWNPFVCDPNEAAQRTRTVGSPAGTWGIVGWQAELAVAVSIGKGAPFGVDVVRYGRCDIVCTEGDVTNGFASFGGSSPDAGAAAYDNNSARRWGLLTPERGAFLQQGLFQMGGAAAVDFRDSNRIIFIRDTPRVSAGFNAFEIRHASSRVDWTNISVTALGTQSRGTFTVVDNADVNLDTCVFTDMGTFTFLAASSALDCTFRRTDTIDAGGGVFNGSTVDSSRVAADESALLWDVADGDPDGNLDDMTFIKGTNAHHAIALTPNAATTSVTLRGITFTGFNAANGENDSVLELEDRGADTTWNINTVLTSGTVSYKKRRAGDTVNIIANPVTLTVTVVDLLTGDPLENVNVLVEAAAGGDLAVGTDIIKTLTDVNGEAADTRTYTSDQPITGRARLATSPGPYYRTGAIAGIIDSANGLSVTVQMILDT